MRSAQGHRWGGEISERAQRAWTAGQEQAVGEWSCVRSLTFDGEEGEVLAVRRHKPSRPLPARSLHHPRPPRLRDGVPHAPRPLLVAHPRHARVGVSVVDEDVHVGDELAVHRPLVVHGGGVVEVVAGGPVRQLHAVDVPRSAHHGRVEVLLPQQSRDAVHRVTQPLTPLQPVTRGGAQDLAVLT